MDDRFLTAAEAARRIGVSPKALRLYERRGLLKPLRTAVGWRLYGPEQMAGAERIAALRALGFGLAEIAPVMRGEVSMEAALRAQQALLQTRLSRTARMMQEIGALRADLATSPISGLGPVSACIPPAIGFALPPPWAGERFEVAPARPLTFITGPLGSGKTRFAQSLAQALPDAGFVGLDRCPRDGTSTWGSFEADAPLRRSVERTLAALVDTGAQPSDALVALLAVLETEAPAALVVDMVEQGLDEPSQRALAAFLRARPPGARPLFLMTRSTAILDLGATGSTEPIILCPANHALPTYVAPYPGTPGYEAVATCLASPEVRARTQGVVACRPRAA